MKWTVVAGRDATGRQVRLQDRGWPTRLLTIAVVATIVILATPARSLAAEANQGVDEPPTPFDIPAQPLSAALEQFMQAAKASVVVDSAMIAEHTSASLQGHFSPEGALRLLLSGTGLAPRSIGFRAYTLDPSPRLGAAQPSPQFSDYAAAIQQAVTSALCRHSETRPTRYRVVMRLWVNPAGAVSHVQLGGSTGSSSLDAAIGDALEHIDIGAPAPTGLPQPVKLAILPRATPSKAACPASDAGDQPMQDFAR